MRRLYIKSAEGKILFTCERKCGVVRGNGYGERRKRCAEGERLQRRGMSMRCEIILSRNGKKSLIMKEKRVQ